MKRKFIELRVINNKSSITYLKSFELAKRSETGEKTKGRYFGISKKAYEEIRKYNAFPEPFFSEDGIMLKIQHPTGTMYDVPVEALNRNKAKIETKKEK